MAITFYDKTALGDGARNRSVSFPLKADIDVFPKQLTFVCGSLQIHTDGTPQHTYITIDGKQAHGVYSLKINLNTQRSTKIEIGAFLDDFKFDLRPRKGE